MASNTQNNNAYKEALEYVEHVKQTLDSVQYRNFIDTLLAYHERRYDMSSVITKMRALFQGNEELLPGFNHFLPQGYSLMMS